MVQSIKVEIAKATHVTYQKLRRNHQSC